MKNYILSFILLVTSLAQPIRAAVLEDIFKPPTFITYTIEYSQIIYVPNSIVITVKFKERPEIFPIVRGDFGYLSRERLLDEIPDLLEHLYPGCQLLIQKEDTSYGRSGMKSYYSAWAGHWEPIHEPEGMAWMGFWMGAIHPPEGTATTRSGATEVWGTFPEDLYWPIPDLYPTFSE